jgi:hypothetical protein
MSLFISLYIAALFVALTPGILLKIPKGGSKLTVAVVHGLVFTVIYCLTYGFVSRRFLVDGFQNTEEIMKNEAAAAAAAAAARMNQPLHAGGRGRRPAPLPKGATRPVALPETQRLAAQRLAAQRAAAQRASAGKAATAAAAAASARKIAIQKATVAAAAAAAATEAAEAASAAVEEKRRTAEIAESAQEEQASAEFAAADKEEKARQLAATTE